MVMIPKKNLARLRRAKIFTKIGVFKGEISNFTVQNVKKFPGAPLARPKKLTKIAISKGEINNCIGQNVIFSGRAEGVPENFH